MKNSHPLPFTSSLPPFPPRYPFSVSPLLPSPHYHSPHGNDGQTNDIGPPVRMLSPFVNVTDGILHDPEFSSLHHSSSWSHPIDVDDYDGLTLNSGDFLSRGPSGDDLGMQPPTTHHFHPPPHLHPQQHSHSHSHSPHSHSLSQSGDSMDESKLSDDSHSPSYPPHDHSVQQREFVRVNPFAPVTYRDLTTPSPTVSHKRFHSPPPPDEVDSIRTFKAMKI